MTNLYFLYFSVILQECNKQGKEVSITVSTGMSSLQFPDGQTIHHWSGYGDGHLEISRIVEEVNISATYRESRDKICNAKLLIIDEIGLISQKVFEAVEAICRSVRKSDAIFGGLQVLASGSFVQLQPVPSENDTGKFCFESPVFKLTFPHRIHLTQVHRQKERDLILAINELCDGYPTPSTDTLMRNLKRPLSDGTNAVYIFGTNFEVDFFNHMTLESLPGNPVLFSSTDTGTVSKLRRCGGSRHLILKKNAKVIVIRNLFNGLVNGIGATVVALSDKSVTVKVDEDAQLPHRLSGRVFTLPQYTFLVRDTENSTLATRKQIPLKLGYGVTVHKAQGRSIEKVVVDGLQFWKPGQFGVAVGRAVSKEGLQVLNYNRYAASLKHPDIISEFYSERSLMMKETLDCCRNKEYKPQVDQIVHDVKTYHLPPINVPEDHTQYLNAVPNILFPFDQTEYIDGFIKEMGSHTDIQKRQIKIIKLHRRSDGFQKFIHTAYSVVSDIFNMYKCCEQKKKCNWCKMCNHLQRFLSSSAYRVQILTAFSTSTLNSDHNSICTRIYFDLLKIITKQLASAARTARIEEFLKSQPESGEMGYLDKSTLRYIAGAAVHSVVSNLKAVCTRQVMNNVYKAKVAHRQTQLAAKLIGPPQQIQNESIEPESLLKLLHKDRGGLLYVTDETFQVFKLMMLRLRKLQNLVTLQTNPENVFANTVKALQTDDEVLDAFMSIFTQDNSNCECHVADAPSDDAMQCIVDAELDESLILDLYDNIVQYVCKVHFAEQMFRLKDHTCQKKKTFRLRTQVEFLNNKEVQHPHKEKLNYPCGKCGNECIDILDANDARFEEFSVLCEFCNKWYHLVCEHLLGNEDVLQEGSSLKYQCSMCRPAGQLVQGANAVAGSSQSYNKAADGYGESMENVQLKSRPTAITSKKLTAKEMRQGGEQCTLSPATSMSNLTLHSSVSKSGRKRQKKIHPDYVY